MKADSVCDTHPSIMFILLLPGIAIALLLFPVSQQRWRFSDGGEGRMKRKARKGRRLGADFYLPYRDGAPVHSEMMNKRTWVVTAQ